MEATDGRKPFLLQDNRRWRLRRGRGAVDVLTQHLASIVLGAGTPLFTGGATRILVQRSVIAASTTKHVIEDVG